jgi:hypothetical protein
MEQFLKVRLGADITDLQKGMNDAQRAITNLKQPTVQTGAALTNLSRVVQDAPFGFIAIQNNIDPLITSFKQIQTQTGSTIGAFKAIGASLIGPAGIAVGLAAVTSLVTTAIQKYGSLGAAVTELAANNDQAAVAQRSLNKAINESEAGVFGEIQTLQNYIGILGNVNASQDQRVAAYQTLKKEYPGIIQNMSQENALAESGVFLLNERSKQLIGYIKLKSKEAALIKLGEEATKKQFEAQRQGLSLVTDQGTLLNQAINNLFGGFIPGGAGAGLNRRLEGVGKDFDKAGKDVDFFAQQLKQTQEELATFDPKITGLDKVVVPKLPKVAKVVQKVEVLEVIPEKARIGTSDTAADIEAIRNFKIYTGIEVPLKLEIPQEEFEKLRKYGEIAKNALDLKILRAQAAEFKNILTEGLAQPLGDLIFNFLDQGKVGFKQFADAAIQSIKRIVAQLIASKIIQLLGNVLFPGAGTAATAIGRIAGSFAGLGGVAVGNIGGALGTGGLQLAGGVSFRIQGTDLVAVMNNANASIGRVG